MGPVERALRDELRRRPLSRDEAKRLHGALGGFHFDRLVKMGAAQLHEGRAHLLVFQRAPRNPVLVEVDRRAAEQHREALAARQRAADEAHANRVRREEEQRRLFAGTEYLPLEERRLVVAERLAALADSREGSEE